MGSGHTFLRIFSATILAVFFAGSHAFGAAPTTRLALIYPADVAMLGDLLSAELSKEPGVVLVEREQVRKIFEEQALSMTQAAAEPGRAGAMLGAEGLIILERPTTEGSHKKAPLRVIWAERGIVVHETVIPIVEKDLLGAAGFVFPQIKLAVRKLADLRKAGSSAVAMHLKAVSSDVNGEIELRQGLALLFSQRMGSEPGWVVVDRRNLTEAMFENKLSRSQESPAPVPATHRLTLGFSKEGQLLNLRGKLELPGGASHNFLFSGKFEEPALLAELMMKELRGAMGLVEKNPAQAWEPKQEAQALFEWAKQTYQKRLFRGIPGREIYEASSAAWALGLREPEVLQLRAIGLCDWAWPKTGWVGGGSNASIGDLKEDRGAVERMLSALELARQSWAFPSQRDPIFMENWVPSQLTIPYWAGEMLRAIYDDRAEEMFADELPTLRKAIREAVDAIPDTQWVPSQPFAKVFSALWKRQVYAKTIIQNCSLWEESYAMAQERMERILLLSEIEEKEKGEPLWRKLEVMLEDGHIFPQYGDVPIKRELRYSDISLFYPRKPADEAECLRRSHEIAAKLAASESIYRQGFARAIEKRLIKLPGGQPLAARPLKTQDADLASYLTGKQLTEKRLPINDPWRTATPSKKVDFILRLLQQRGPDQYLHNEIFEDIIQMWNTNSRARFAPVDAIRLAEGFDDYWKATEALRNTPGKAVMSYAERMGSAMDVLRSSYPEVKALLQERSPDRPIPAGAFTVTHCWSAKDWKGQISLPLIAESQSDGVNLFIPQTPEGTLHSGIQGVNMISPPKWEPKQILNNSGPIIGLALNSLAVDGRYFFTARNERWTDFYSVAAGRAPITQRLQQGNTANVSFLGFFAPYVYLWTEARNPADRENRCQLNRWNLESNQLELVGDSLRIPNVSPLDAALSEKPALDQWAIRLPDGDVGLLIARISARASSLKATAFRISTKTGTVSVLGEWDPKAPPSSEWALPFREAGAQRAWGRTAENSPTTQPFEILEDSPYFPSRVLYRAPFPASLKWMAGNWTRTPDWRNFTTITPLLLIGNASDAPAGSPPIEGSCSPFMVGDIHGLVSFERIKGRESRAQTWLSFFEPDGIKSVPLRFEVPPKDIGPLLSYFRTELGWKVADDYKPRPFTDDRAWGVKDALVISNAKANILWILSRDELIAARKLAK